MKALYLHKEIERAVAKGCGCNDFARAARCEFLLVYEEKDEELASSNQSLVASKKSKKKKPWRLRWPDDFRDEVLARLLELNEQRHKEELRSGLAAEASEKEVSKPKAKRTAKKQKSAMKKASPQNRKLF